MTMVCIVPMMMMGGDCVCVRAGVGAGAAGPGCVCGRGGGGGEHGPDSGGRPGPPHPAGQHQPQTVPQQPQPW